MQYSCNNSTTITATGLCTIGTTTPGTITTEPNIYTSTIGTFDPNIITTSKVTVTTKNETMKQKPYCRIEEIVPEKVYKFHFKQIIIKTVCAEEDEFSLEYAYYLAEAKKLYKKTCTFEGVLKHAEQLQQLKEYNKHYREAIRLFKEEQKEKHKEEELKEIRKRQHEKYIAKKLKRKEKQRQEQISIIREAIKGE